MLRSARPPRVYESIVEELEGAIFAGRLAAGDKLPPERQLVQSFGASRVAVREALRALEHRGLVEVRQGSAGGYFIREVDGDVLFRDFQTLLRLGRVSVTQLAEARILVEPEVAALAAARATEADLKALGAAIDESAARAGAGREPRALDVEFHRRVAQAARNPVHAFVIHALMDLEIEVVPRFDLPPEEHAAVDGAHREIRDAIAARQPQVARAAMLAHVVDVQRRLRRAQGFAGGPPAT